MARLIDAKELERQIKVTFKDSNPVLMGQMLRWVRVQQTIDAVPVVRCKDCIHFDERQRTVGNVTGKVYCSGNCYHWDYEQGMSPNQVIGYDFCSYGERKDNV